jgi:hypothetical protein
MLFPVARQREAPMKSLSGNNVAVYLAMTPSQQYGKETVFCAVCAKPISPPLQPMWRRGRIPPP